MATLSPGPLRPSRISGLAEDTGLPMGDPQGGLCPCLSWALSLTGRRDQAGSAQTLSLLPEGADMGGSEAPEGAAPTSAEGWSDGTLVQLATWAPLPSLPNARKRNHLLQVQVLHGCLHLHHGNAQDGAQQPGLHGSSALAVALLPST